MKFEKEQSKVPNEELADILEQFSNKGDFVKIDGKIKQLFIGEVKETEGFIEVETLAGCDKIALKDTMYKIAEKTGKEVKANFGDEEIIVEPENIEEKE